ncbi:MAG TPA: hypothetical protein VIL37_00335 [Natronosporangium sp.]
MGSILRWWARHDRSAAPRVLGALVVVLLLGSSGMLAAMVPPIQVAGSRAAEVEQSPSQPPTRAAPQARGVPPAATPPPVWLVEPAGDFVGWAVVEYDPTGVIGWSGSKNATEVSTTASMIKAWIAADYLRRATEAGQQPSPARLNQLTAVIRDSDNAYAEEIFQELGAHESTERLIEICDLPHARAYPYSWSNTQLSPMDAALMGVCIADGRAAGPEWTEWLLSEMRQVRGRGDFGIRQALPPEQRSSIAIKNGWVERTNQSAWHVNCLAIGPTWTMAVMTRYPAELGFEHGAELCRLLAASHLPGIDGTDA